LNTKQVIVIRKDLKMRRGKEIAQGAHAASAWMVGPMRDNHEIGIGMMPGDPPSGIFRTDEEIHWLVGSQAKICCQVNSEAELLALDAAAKSKGLKSYLILDEGRTEFGGKPTYTCLAIGPDEVSKIDEVTGKLELY
jgi:peptidyl-tRNA hydrolase, PTH2 family